MIYRLAASATLFLHFIFVFIAVFGAAGLFVDWRWALIHIPIVVWSSVVNLAGWTCPLTPLENRFLFAARKTGYEGGFVQHYLGPLVYPKGMPRRLELIAGVSIVAWNVIAYGIVWWLGFAETGGLVLRIAGR